MIAIWGIGLYGSRFSAKIGRENFDLFIDKKPWCTEHVGHKVVHPDDITEKEWKELFVYVPLNYFEEIKSYLEKKGLIEKKDFMPYGSKLELDETLSINDFERFKVEVNNSKSWREKTVIWGRFWQKKEYRDFFIKMRENRMNLALLSEAIWMNRDEVEKIMGIESISAPLYSDEESIIIRKKPYDKNKRIDDRLVNGAIAHLKDIHDSKGDESYLYTAEKIYEYIVYAIDKLEIRRIICLGSENVQHEILALVCRDRDIEIVYSHQGVLPGTLSFDTTGEIGESIPTLVPTEFKKLSVSRAELINSKKIINSLRQSGANRKAQPKTEWKRIIEGKIHLGRPIILYAGQHDVHSHMIPYNDRARKHYSPIFKTSDEALIFLAKLCERNDWNLIYKPHPMYTYKVIEENLPQNVLYVPYGDINEMIDYSDVVITILSTSNYIALIREKPVVMLGYNQIYQKGCTYEAFDKRSVEMSIKDACQNGYSNDQKNAFILHVAQLTKYYLYDDLQHEDFKYGKTVPKDFSDFYELERLIAQ